MYTYISPIPSFSRCTHNHTLAGAHKYWYYFSEQVSCLTVLIRSFSRCMAVGNLAATRVPSITTSGENPHLRRFETYERASSANWCISYISWFICLHGVANRFKTHVRAFCSNWRLAPNWQAPLQYTPRGAAKKLLLTQHYLISGNIVTFCLHDSARI